CRSDRPAYYLRRTDLTNFSGGWFAVRTPAATDTLRLGFLTSYMSFGRRHGRGYDDTRVRCDTWRGRSLPREGVVMGVMRLMRSVRDPAQIALPIREGASIARSSSR